MSAQPVRLRFSRPAATVRVVSRVWTARALSLALLALPGCAKILGVSDYTVSGPSAKSGPVTSGKCGAFSYLAMATSCEQCVEAHCCTESAACAADPGCEFQHGCELGCAPNDVDCNAKCSTNAGTESTAYFGIASCSLQHCSAACGIWRTNACAACFFDKCPSESAALFSDEPSYSLFVCRDLCPGFEDQCPCVVPSSDVLARVQTFETCYSAACPSCNPLNTSQPDWFCLGHEAPALTRSAQASSLELHLGSVVPNNLLPGIGLLPGIHVSACGADVNCTNPTAEAVADDHNWADLSIPPPLGGGRGVPYFEYIEFEDRTESGAPRVADNLYATNTIDIYPTTRWTVGIPRADLDTIMTAGKTTWAPDTGLALVFVVGCTVGSGSVRVTVPDSPSAVVFYADMRANVATDATLAPVGDVAWITGLKPGEHTFEAYNSANQLVVRYISFVRADALTFLFLKPQN